MGSIFLYQASAGSGKTYQLSLNYLKLLKKLSLELPSSLKSILAITFTNKAAYEMKERVIYFLKEIAKQSEEGKRLSEETELTPEEADLLLENLFLYYDYLEIRTIDSFLFKLFKGLSYELNLSPEFTVSTFLKEELLDKAFYNLFERAKKEPSLLAFLELFLETLLNYEEAQKLNFRKKIIRQLKDFVEASTYTEELLKEEKFIDMNLSEESHPAYLRGKTLFTILSLLKEELEKVLFEEGVLYMGIWKEKLARGLKEDFIPIIYVKLGRFKAFIIDEFQDTDRLQWLSVYPLVENLVSEGNILILAGDPKQTIYRWKGGDPKLLKDVKKAFENFGLKEIPLEKNFRSCANLVEFNNTFFSLLKELEELKSKVLFELTFTKNEKANFQKQESPQQALFKEILKICKREFDELFSQIKQESVKNYDGKVFIEWLKFQEKVSNEELRENIFKRIEEILEELKNKGELEDTAILLRENEEVSLLTSYLISKGYEVLGSSFLSLKESPLAQALISFLKLLFYPEDDLALTTVLIGIFRKEGEELIRNYKIFKNQNNFYASLSYYLKEFHQDFYESKILLPLKKGYFLNTYQFLAHLISHFELDRLFPEEAPYLHKLLSLSLSYVSQGKDLYDFLRDFEELSKAEVDLTFQETPLKVLTIHSSKGLEFKNVIVPLNFKVSFSNQKLKGLFIHENLIFKGKKEELPEELKQIIYLNKVENVLEVFNLLYVAFTRAIKNLYILVPLKSDGKTEEACSHSSQIFKVVFLKMKERAPHLFVKGHFQERSLVLENSQSL